ncbi:MAG: ribonuclease E/G, partial [Lentisphaeria bacterium]|nr:ribonuclease E/G [Lentisphaeria bacterium]
MKKIIVNAEHLQTRIALVENDKIDEYYIERTDDKRIVGSIFKGKIRNLENSLQAAFVDIGLDKNSFLHYWDMIPATEESFDDDDDEFDDIDDTNDSNESTPD